MTSFSVGALEWALGRRVQCSVCVDVSRIWGQTPEIAHRMRATGAAPLRPSQYRPTGDLSHKEPSGKHQLCLSPQAEWRAIRQALFDIIIGCAGQVLGVLLILAGLGALGWFVYAY